MLQPLARGPVSALLIEVLAAAPRVDSGFGAASAGPGQADAVTALGESVRIAVTQSPDVVFDGDLQLTLFCLYELHYGGIAGVSDNWEWAPELIAVRRQIERAFEAKLRSVIELPERPVPTAAAVAKALFRLTADDGGPSMSRYVAKRATIEQAKEFLIHKSIYQLREADPHTWAIPRLSGRAKAALVEIQADEYGGGRPERVHSVLFARAMRGATLDAGFGGYVDVVPAITLATANLMSMFGLNRRLRGAIVGHLTAYEMTSSQPSRQYAKGFRRHGFGADVTEYFDEHVEADAVHEQIAGHDMSGALVEAEPELLDDVLFGAAAGLTLESWLGRHIMTAWESGGTSLRNQPSLVS